jgi:hypothetical protein
MEIYNLDIGISNQDIQDETIQHRKSPQYVKSNVHREPSGFSF